MSEEEIQADFEANHIPNLYRYSVLIAHENEDGTESIGSGTTISINGRHFIATAAHCMVHNPRIIADSTFSFVGDERLESDRLIRPIAAAVDELRDIGYLELSEAFQPELSEHNCDSSKILEGTIHVIGHPVAGVERGAISLSIKRRSFGSNVIEQTDDLIRLAYQTEGRMLDDAKKKLVSVPIDDPHGFSGGGCFGIAMREVAGIQVVEYKMVALQTSWSRSKRWINTVPIRRWIELVQS
jgi:hypothetical protein